MLQGSLVSSPLLVLQVLPAPVPLHDVEEDLLPAPEDPAMGDAEDEGPPALLPGMMLPRRHHGGNPKTLEVRGVFLDPVTGGLLRSRWSFFVGGPIAPRLAAGDVLTGEGEPVRCGADVAAALLLRVHNGYADNPFRFGNAIFGPVLNV